MQSAVTQTQHDRVPVYTIHRLGGDPCGPQASGGPGPHPTASTAAQRSQKPTQTGVRPGDARRCPGRGASVLDSDFRRARGAGPGPATVRTRTDSAHNGVASRRASAGWTRPRHLPEDPLLAGDRCRFVRRIVALKMPTVVHATQPLDDHAFPGVHAEHLPIKRFGPTGIEHHEVAVADGRRHGIAYHPRAPQSVRTRPGRQSRSSDRDGHLGCLVPHRLARHRSRDARQDGGLPSSAFPAGSDHRRRQRRPAPAPACGAPGPTPDSSSGVGSRRRRLSPGAAPSGVSRHSD